MYFIVSNETEKVWEDVKPWVVGMKSVNSSFVPEFKKNTPEEIKTKYNHYVNLLKQEAKAVM